MQYKLPIASSEVLGGIEVGEDFEIDPRTGTLNIKNMSAMQKRVEDIITNIAQGKAMIAEKITEKGVITEPTDSFAVMAENIEAITRGGGVIALTKAQYDELSNEEKYNGSVYQVTTPAGGDGRIVSLLHFNDSIISDDTGKLWNVSDVSKVALDTGIKKFGNSSLRLDGGYLMSPVTSDFFFEDNDFTIDAWVYLRSTTRQAFFAMSETNPYSGDYRVGVDMLLGTSANQWASSTGKSWNLVSGDDSQGRGSINLQQNTWTHIALVRHGTDLITFIDGQIACINNIGTASIYHTVSDFMKLGAWGNNGYLMYSNIDEFCVKNSAVWTDEFTPPTEPYEAYHAQTVDLYYMGVKYSIN